ncbi:MAG: RtcB family protein [Fimbriimonadales bacterium]
MSQRWKGTLEQVDTYRWRIPKDYKPGMRVDGLIFASAEMLGQIVQDQAPEQVANVAFLPGVVGYSIAMPDIHWGYGFPVGGVAAMDLGEGVISPGGIGYDINCLHPSTRVLTEHGYWRAIGDAPETWLGQSVACFRLGEGVCESGVVGAAMQVRPPTCAYRLRTATGYEVIATGEHPFWTPAGMQRLEQLEAGARVAVYPFEGVPYTPAPDAMLLDAAQVRMHLTELGQSASAIHQIVARLRDAGLLPLRADASQVAYLAKLMGSLTGGGTIRFTNRAGEGIAVFYGSPEGLARIRTDLARLGFESVSDNRHSLYVRSGAFVALMACLGVPVADTVDGANRVPRWLHEAPLWQQRLYLAALFGTRLSPPNAQTASVPTFHAPELHIDTIAHADVQAMLERFGVQARLQGTPAPRLQILPDDANLIRLWSHIGYEYHAEHQRLACLAVAYLRLKRAVVAQRKQPRLPKGFPRFAEFAEQACAGVGMVWDVVKSVEPIEYAEPFVYDLTVQHPDHNFVANGFVVSNCGVRLLRTDLTEQQVRPRLKELLDQIFRDVPAGFGGEGLIRTTRADLRQVMLKGAHWMIEHGYGWEDDLAHTEATGRLDMPDPDVITEKAIERGKDQLGTLGGGNHFLEIQAVDAIYDPVAAAAMGITQVGQVTVMIHTGSRGFGHQTCQDHLDIMEEAIGKYGIRLPDRQLACAPIQSEEGQTYLRAMHCAANFAFANRQAIAHWTRQAFAKIFNATPESLGMHQVYDVAHNIAKIEEHLWEGKPVRVCVHRKGATRAFPPGHPETPEAYRAVGQPVLIPGDMGRYSFVLVGSEGAMRESFGTTCHGAGRMMSRKGAIREAKNRNIAKEMEAQGILVRAQNKATLAEEASYAYKDVADVVEVVHNAGLARKVARLRPLGVVKG